jgi:Amt family ammonium transporter
MCVSHTAAAAGAVAGGVIVHVVGGTASLWGAYFIGPRAGRFGLNGEPNKDFRENNGNLVVLGTFLLWFGWYGFNPGSAATITGPYSASIVSRTAVATTLAAGMGGLATMVLFFAMYR